MAQTTGLVLAAGGIALANETVFAAKKSDFSEINWKIVPATGILALTLAGVEQLAPGFAKALAGLVLISVLVIPVGKSPTPFENLDKWITSLNKVAKG